MPVAGLRGTGGRRKEKGAAVGFPAGSRHLSGWAAQPLRTAPACRGPEDVEALEAGSALQKESAPAPRRLRRRGGATSQRACALRARQAPGGGGGAR